jgi:hypothetical protein
MQLDYSIRYQTHCWCTYPVLSLLKRPYILFENATPTYEEIHKRKEDIRKRRPCRQEKGRSTRGNSLLLKIKQISTLSTIKTFRKEREPHVRQKGHVLMLFPMKMRPLLFKLDHINWRFFFSQSITKKNVQRVL